MTSEEQSGNARGLLGGDDLLARLDRWLSDARTTEAAAARVRERWLVQAAEESATFAGVLVDLAERAAPVVVVTRGDRRHRGVVAAVASDFCIVRTPAGRDLIIAFAGIASVRIDPTAGAPAGDRSLHVDVGLAEALAALAGDRPRVLLVTSGQADGIAGELRSVGRDVVTLRLNGDSGGTAYLPIDAIVEVTLA
jgi:hypothetical protein